ncbi:MAG: hypothetical protein IPM23_03295 [Candidatus Melainabacteria bacterium]|nr:hypothetical protein [Candidatus Melainabacteria bacterium]
MAPGLSGPGACRLGGERELVRVLRHRLERQKDRLASRLCREGRDKRVLLLSIPNN